MTSEESSSPLKQDCNMDINPKDPLEMFVDGDQIILQKYEPCSDFLRRLQRRHLLQGQEDLQQTPLSQTQVKSIKTNIGGFT